MYHIGQEAVTYVRQLYGRDKKTIACQVDLIPHWSKGNFGELCNGMRRPKPCSKKPRTTGTPKRLVMSACSMPMPKGCHRTIPAARRWYEKAAAAGNASAMNNLGTLYDGGRGVRQDYAEARRWYEKAAAGNENARKRLTELNR